MTPRSRLAPLALSLAAAAALTAACSSGSADSSGPAGTATAPAATGSVSAAQLKTVTLHVGDQAGAGAQALLTAADLIGKLPFKVDWSDFTSGPPLLQAMAAGSVDVGAVGDAPPIFELAGGGQISLVAATVAASGGDALLLSRGSSVTSVAQLKGKAIAVTEGSAADYHLLVVLKKAGLAIKDVTVENLQPAQAQAAFASGHVAAWDIWSPFIEQAEITHGARVLVNGSAAGQTYGFEVASRATLTDPAKVAAIRDYLALIARAHAWANTHPAAWAVTWSAASGLPLPIMTQAARDETSVTVPISAAVISSEQSVANAFTTAGLIPAHVNIASAPSPPSTTPRTASPPEGPHEPGLPLVPADLGGRPRHRRPGPQRAAGRPPSGWHPPGRRERRAAPGHRLPDPGGPGRRAGRLHRRADPDRHLVRGCLAGHLGPDQPDRAAAVPGRVPAGTDLADAGRPDGRDVPAAVGRAPAAERGDRREAAGQARFGDHLPHDERYARTGEFLDVVRGAWSGTPYDFSGQYYQVRGATVAGRPDPVPQVYFGGSSAAAGPVAARGADVYLTWGEPPAQVAEKIAWVRRLATAAGRTLRFGIRLHVITRDTAGDAWAEASRLLDRIDPDDIQAAQTALSRSESVGQSRMRSLHAGYRDGGPAAELEVSPNLWAGIGLVRGGAGTALVGSHQEVADRIEEYAALGIEEFIFSGYPHLEEAYWFGEGVLPELRRRAAATPRPALAGAAG